MLFRKKEAKTNSFANTKALTEKTIPEQKAQTEFKINLKQQIFELPTVKDKTKLNIRYPLIAPFAYAHIFWDEKRHELIYQVEEPILNSDEQRVLAILEKGIEELINISFIAIKSSEVIIKYLEENVKVLLNEYRIKVNKNTLLKLMYYIYRDFVGLNEIEPIMRDYFIEDIECNGVNSSVYIVHRKYRNIRTNVLYNDVSKLTSLVEKLAQKCGKYISYASPLLDGALPDGSRANATYTQDITSKGPTFTIRKFTVDPWSPVKLMQFRTVSPEVLAYLWLLIEYESNVLIVGGTGTGKTSFLNSIAFFVPPQARIVSIEDTRELNLLHENWLPSVAREGVGITSLVGTKQGEVTLFDLLKESFRQRPDYVVVGEIRGAEAYVLFQGMSSIRGDEKIMVLNDEHPKRISIKDMKKDIKYKVITYDELGNVKIMPVKFMIRHSGQKVLYEIITKKGRKITISKNHSLFNYDNGIIPIEAEKIKKGDRVLIPSKIPCGYCDFDEIDIMEYLSDIRVFAPDHVKEASHKLGYYKASKICGVCSITDYYSNFKRSKPSSLRAEKFVRLMKEAGLKYNKDDLIFKYDNRSKGFMGNLKLTPELLRLCGYYVSEGSLDDGENNSKIEFYNLNKEILDDMRHCIRKVTGSDAKERITYGFGKSIELSVNHRVLFEFLKRHFGKKENKHIPDFVFGLSKEKISALLSGLYTGDGSLTKDVGYYTISKELANDVAQLLLVYGIVARIGKRKRKGRKKIDYEVLFFSKWEKDVFLENVKIIGKRIIMKKIGKPKSSNYVNDLYLDIVLKINKKILKKPEPVYDLCVPGTQNFIGGFGGVLLHNSGHPSMGTMHAEDLHTMIRRLESPPINLSPTLVNSLDVVCIMANIKQEGKETRKVKKIIEIVKIGDKAGEETINEPFIWDPKSDKFYFKSHGKSYLKMDSRAFDKITTHYGISREKLMDEFRKRTLLLMRMYKAGITGFKEVHNVITAYYKTPDMILKKFGIS
ncbi:Flp pilus assembly complex ATPase component TadA [Candidatus Woesearchaeota archaeon]|nr:Flp pilus assembly complex ATPase component TadA [Candidatus Woesearchaeota archaeon]